jgi:hypothetical protein
MPTGDDQFDYNEMNDWTDDRSVESFNTLPTYTPPPVGQYVFKLTRKHPNTPVKPEFNKSGKPKFQAQFEFTIVGTPPGLEAEWTGHVVKQFYNISLNEKSNLLPVVQALIGRDLEATDKMGWQDGQRANADGTVDNIVGIGGRYMSATLTHKKNQQGKVYPKLIGPIPAPANFTEAEAAVTTNGNVPF